MGVTDEPVETTTFTDPIVKGVPSGYVTFDMMLTCPKGIWIRACSLG